MAVQGFTDLFDGVRRIFYTSPEEKEAYAKQGEILGKLQKERERKKEQKRLREVNANRFAGRYASDEPKSESPSFRDLIPSGSYNPLEGVTKQGAGNMSDMLILFIGGLLILTFLKN